MKNTIFDYLEWRGDLSFEIDKFNKIDALILARLVYIPFDNMIENEMVLEKVLKIFLKSRENLENVIMENDIKLVKKILKCERFNNLKISNYINKIDLEVEKQFCAMTIKINENLKIVVFSGTDNTVVGWKEDFNMSFLTHVPAQLEAVMYLKKVMEEDNLNIILAGHSKGGNLSVYSSIFVDEKYKDKIIKIYNFDGPGFNEEIINNVEYEKILDKIETYIPKGSVVGILLERKEIPKIILSNEKLIMQHDLYSWEIARTDFLYVDDLSKESKMLMKNIQLWLNNVSVEERKEFIDALFNSIFNINTDMKEIINNWQQSLKVITKASQDPVFKDMLQKSIKIFVDSVFKKDKNLEEE